MDWPYWLYALTDPRDAWLAEDKAVHVGFGALWWQALGRLDAGPHVLVFWLGLLAWEAFEVARRFRWIARGAPVPRPWACDQASVKDVLAGGLGILAALVLSAVGGPR